MTFLEIFFHLVFPFNPYWYKEEDESEESEESGESKGETSDEGSF